MIHCANASCGLIITSLAQSVQCPSCVELLPGETQQLYCSNQCLNLDWYARHQFQCGRYHQRLTIVQQPTASTFKTTKSSVTSTFKEIDPSEIERISPFIKHGFLQQANERRDEAIFARIKLSDLVFEKKLVGKGSYGTVQLARDHRSGLKVAVKRIQKSCLTTQRIRETIRREIEIQKQLKHTNIVRLYTSIEDETDIYLIMEYAEQGNLLSVARSRAQSSQLSEDEAFYFFIQTAAGIYFLHQNGIIHRDLKPENLLIGAKNVVKICDFGWSVKEQATQQRTTFCGTLEYMSPEMINKLSHNHTVDVWALGILLFELCHGKAPFRGEYQTIGKQINRGQLPFKKGLSKEYIDLVSRLLEQDPNKRLPLVRVFVHSWVLHFQQKYRIKRPDEQKNQKINTKNIAHVSLSPMIEKKQTPDAPSEEENEISFTNSLNEEIGTQLQMIFADYREQTEEIEDLYNDILEGMDEIDCSLIQNQSDAQLQENFSTPNKVTKQQTDEQKVTTQTTEFQSKFETTQQKQLMQTSTSLNTDKKLKPSNISQLLKSPQRPKQNFISPQQSPFVYQYDDYDWSNLSKKIDQQPIRNKMESPSPQKSQKKSPHPLEKANKTPKKFQIETQMIECDENNFKEKSMHQLLRIKRQQLETGQKSQILQIEQQTPKWQKTSFRQSKEFDGNSTINYTQYKVREQKEIVEKKKSPDSWICRLIQWFDIGECCQISECCQKSDNK